MTGQPKPRPTQSSKRGAAGLAIPYAVCTLVGAAPVFLDKRMVLFPILVMMFYLVYGLRQAQSEGFELEFADSFYYLGFTLTIASLLASLDPLHPTAPLDPRDVLHFFGLGMFTTLIGVTGRTVLQMFYRTPDESIESTNRRIAEAGNVFLGRIEELVARADDVLAGTLRALDTHIKRHVGDTGVALDGIATQLKRAASEIGEFHFDGRRIEASLSDVTLSISNASRRASESLTAATQASDQLAQISSSARDSTRDAANGVEQAVARLATQVHAAATASESLSAVLERIGAAPERLDQSVTALERAFDSLARRLGEQFGATGSAATLSSAALTEFSRQMGSVSIGNIQKELQNLEASLVLFREAFDSDGRKPDVRMLGDLTLALEKSLAGAKLLNDVLDEIVEAVELKLDKVR